MISYLIINFLIKNIVAVPEYPLVTRIAGNHDPGNTNGIGTNTLFSGPASAVISRDRTFALIVDQNNAEIRKIILSTLSVTTFVGNGGSGNANGIGTNAQIQPQFMSLSPDDSYALIADWNNQQIRKVLISTAEVSNFAGKLGQAGSTNGVGTDAQFSDPSGVDIASNGEFALIGEYTGARVRKIVLSTVQVSTIAGSGTTGIDDGVGTFATFNGIRQITISPDRTYALVAEDSKLIRKIILSTGSVTTFVGNSDGSSDGIGTNANVRAFSVSFYPDGTFALIADTNNQQIRKLEISTLQVSPYIGSGNLGEIDGVGTNVEMYGPTQIAISIDGTFAIIAEHSWNNVRRVIITTTPLDVPSLTPQFIGLSVTTFAGNSAGSANGVGTSSTFRTPSGVSISPDLVYALVADRDNNQIRKLIRSTGLVHSFVGVSASGSSNGIGTNSKFNGPQGVDISSNGNFAIVADTSNNQIRIIIISSRLVSLLAGSTTAGIANGAGTNAKFDHPTAVSISPTNHYILVADSLNHQIRKVVIATADVTTLVGSTQGNFNGIGSLAKFNTPTGISISKEGGYALIADSLNNQIRRLIISTASVSLFAGSTQGNSNGIGTGAQFHNPVAVDISNDGVYALIVDNLNQQIRKVIITSKQVQSFVGQSSSGSTNSIGTSAKFNNPTGVSISPTGRSALVADASNNRIRKIQILPPPPTKSLV